MKKTHHLQIVQNENFLKNKKIGLAISGGVDSVVLLDLFYRLEDRCNFELYVLHYNHKWRRTSYKDVELVKWYCNKNKIRFLYGENSGKIIKSEEEARNQRYSFFEKVAKEYKLDFICTGHHKDDQLETIIFRLARGTGPKGILPIKELQDFRGKTKLYRPLLSITKKQICDYANENNLIYIEDKTNKEIKYKRNLIRNKIIPCLKKINKKAENNILTFSKFVYSQFVSLDNYYHLLL